MRVEIGSIGLGFAAEKPNSGQTQTEPNKPTAEAKLAVQVAQKRPRPTK